MAVGVGRMELRPATIKATGTVGAAFASTAAAFDAPDRRAAVLALEPLYKEIPDPILHTIVAGAEQAGPHLGNPNFSEEMLRELARFEQGQRETVRLKQEAKTARAWSLGEKLLLALVAAAVGALLALAGLS